MKTTEISTLKVGDTFEAAVNLNHIRSRILTWTVRKENKSSWTVSASDEHGSLCLYLCKKTGKIKR